MANTIDSALQLDVVLESALMAFKRAIIPLTSFSHKFSDVPLQGTDKMQIPYYPLSTSASVSRAAGASYSALASATATNAREVEINRNLLQAISFTPEEVSRQPAFDPEMHGTLKGHKLALDVIADIFGIISAGRFTGATIAATAASNFDDEDVADLMQDAMEANWPEYGRSLILNPAFYTNLVKQPPILDLSQSGSIMALREGMCQRLYGFDVFGTNGMLTNNIAAAAVTANASTDVLTKASAHGLNVLDRVRFTTTDTLPAGLSPATDYFVLTVPTTATFTVSATPGGAVVNITDTGTGTHSVERYENLAGIAVVPSAILTGFAPIPPTPAIADQLYDYRVIDDPDSDLVLEYRHFANVDTHVECQVIECHYGVGYGEVEALKRIITA